MKQSKRLEYFFLRVQGIAAFIVVGILITILEGVYENTKGLDKSVKNIYQVVIASDTVEIKDSPPEKIKQLYDWEKSNFKYIIANKQPLWNLDSKLNKNGDIDMNNVIQVNDNFFEHYSIRVNEGRLFNDEDYVLKSRTLPVILGSNYKNEHVKLYEQFAAKFMGEKINLKVVGFLKKGSYYMAYGALELLDNHIIMPSIEEVSGGIIQDEGVRQEVPAILDIYNKCENYIEASENVSLNSLKAAFENESQMLALDTPYTVYGIFGMLQIWGIEGKMLLNLLKMLALIIVIILIVCMSINLATKVLSLKKFYAIFIANGVKKSTIYFSIIREILGINLLPLLLLVIFDLFFARMAIFTYLGLSLYIVISVLASIYPCLVFKRLNIAKTLQGDN